MPTPASQGSAATGPHAVEIPAFAVIGLTTRTSNEREMAAAGGRIGPLWHSFMNGSADPIPDVLDGASTFSVYTGYESDHTGAYDVILGRTVRDPSNAPAGMRGIAIPAGRYLLFRAAGHGAPGVQAAWRGVYDYFASHGTTRRAFTWDFEKHSSQGVELYIAVR